MRDHHWWIPPFPFRKSVIRTMGWFVPLVETSLGLGNSSISSPIPMALLWDRDWQWMARRQSSGYRQQYCSILLGEGWFSIVSWPNFRLDFPVWSSKPLSISRLDGDACCSFRAYGDVWTISVEAQRLLNLVLVIFFIYLFQSCLDVSNSGNERYSSPPRGIEEYMWPICDEVKRILPSIASSIITSVSS